MNVSANLDILNMLTLGQGVASKLNRRAINIEWALTQPSYDAMIHSLQETFNYEETNPDFAMLTERQQMKAIDKYLVRFGKDLYDLWNDATEVFMNNFGRPDDLIKAFIKGSSDTSIFREYLIIEISKKIQQHLDNY